MNHTLVIGPDGKLQHLILWHVFMDSSGPAACGKRVWPARWTEAPDDTVPVCWACLDAAREAVTK